MKIVQLDRQRGKTTGCIAWLCENTANYLVVMDHREVSRIRQTYPVVADRVLPWDAVQWGKLRGRHDVSLAIDNLDLILTTMLGHPIELATIN